MSCLPFLRFGLVSTVLLAAAACNKGDTDPVDTSGGDTDTDVGSEDTTAPGALSTSPFDGEIDVALEGAVTITFDEALDPATVTDETFTVKIAGVAVDGSVSYAAQTATFTPADVLAELTLFDAEVTTGITDVAGNPLAVAYAWSFSTTLLPDVTLPSIVSTSPGYAETNVSLARRITVEFSEPIDPTTIDDTTFQVMSGAMRVDGVVSVSGHLVTFAPADHLTMATAYEARVSDDIRDLAGNALAEDYAWTFVTGTETPGLPVDLGTAGDFAILAKTAISTVPASAITGDIGVSPAAASYITGFSLTEDSTGVFSTSPQVTGQVFASDYDVPTPYNLTGAVLDMELAFTDAAGRAPDFTELGAGDVGGMTLTPGVYKWGTGLLIPTDITLDGNATDVWVFQISQDLTLSSGVQVHMTGGALPKNVFWQVAGLVELGTTAHLEGVVMSQTSVTLRTGASVNGRLLAQSAVIIDASTIVEPAE